MTWKFGDMLLMTTFFESRQYSRILTSVGLKDNLYDHLCENLTFCTQNAIGSGGREYVLSRFSPASALLIDCRVLNRMIWSSTIYRFSKLFKAIIQTILKLAH